MCRKYDSFGFLFIFYILGYNSSNVLIFESGSAGIRMIQEVKKPRKCTGTGSLGTVVTKLEK